MNRYFFFSPGESTYRICVIASRRSDLREERLLRKEEARSILVLDGMARLIRERVFEEVDEQENMGQVRRWRGSWNQLSLVNAQDPLN